MRFKDSNSFQDSDEESHRKNRKLDHVQRRLSYPNVWATSGQLSRTPICREGLAGLNIYHNLKKGHAVQS
jgi:hypothetical protein